jgi:plasmid stabilization system protein ParE
MSYAVVWSQQAVEDVRRLYQFLAEKNIEAAKAATAAILQKAEILDAHPNAGRPANDLEPEHRELVIPCGASGYVMLYEIVGEDVLVLAVRHQKEAGY